MSRLFFKDPSTKEVFEYSAGDVERGSVRQGLERMSEKEIYEHLKPSSVAMSRHQVEQSRLLAYADPFNGCDRFQSEANAERLSGNEEAAIIAEKRLLDRREEIKLENPWPGDEK